MADVYPPVRQRPTLLAFSKALGSASTALRPDESGGWRISGKLGHVYAVPGTLDRPMRPGFLIYCERDTGQAWTWAKKRLGFCAVMQDGNTLFLDHLPTEAEAEILRDVIGITKRPVYSDDVLAAKRELGRRIGERSEENPGSETSRLSATRKAPNRKNSSALTQGQDGKTSRRCNGQL
jgi:hypothetical protein